MTARALLRAATAAEHARVDRLYSRYDLSDAAGYRDFLKAQAAAFLPVEQALDLAAAGQLVDDWPARRRGDVLRADLDALGLTPPAPAGPAPDLADPARLLGALYVLEGSRLGGAVLRKNLPAGLPQAFLGARPEPGGWRKLLELLDKNLYGTERIDAAIFSAREVFMLFEAAASDCPATRAA